MRRASRDERGLTLVELMVVILIIAVLIAIAIPTFMGFRRRADDVAAKSGANLAIKVAKSLTDEDSYAPVTLGALSTTEPSLTFVLGSSQSTGPLGGEPGGPGPAPADLRPRRVQPVPDLLLREG